MNDGLEDLLQFFTDVLNVIGETEHFMFILKAATEGTDEQLPLGIVSFAYRSIARRSIRRI